MGKLKIERGISRIKRAKLQTYIDHSVAEDIALMAEWTNNEQHYIVNELLRFALTQSEGFQKFKTEHATGDLRTMSDTKRNLVASTIADELTQSSAKPLPSPSAKPTATAVSTTGPNK